MNTSTTSSTPFCIFCILLAGNRTLSSHFPQPTPKTLFFSIHHQNETFHKQQIKMKKKVEEFSFHII